MSKNKYRKEKEERDMQAKGEELGLIREPIVLDIEQTKEEEKHYEEPYFPYGGATSFADMDAYHSAREKAREIGDLSYAFERLVSNVLSDESIAEKDVAITSLAVEFQQRMQSQKGVLEKVVDKVKEIFSIPEKKEEVEHIMSFKLLKDAEGNDRWLGWFTNNYKDKEGEIISDEAHKEFVSYLDANPDKAPMFRSWHTPGTDREYPIDFWDYDNGFFLVGGKLKSEEAVGLQKAIDYTEGKIGLSHGFYGVRDKNDSRVIVRYRTFEISDLPLAKAANGWTGLDLIQKEALSMDKAKRDYLVAQHGEEFVAGIESEQNAKKSVLDALSVEKKELEEAVVPKEKDLTASIIETLGMKELSETIKAFSQDVEALKADVVALKMSTDEANKELDEKVAEVLEPPGFFWVKQRPSQSDDTLLKDDEVDQKLKASTPFGWVQEAIQ